MPWAPSISGSVRTNVIAHCALSAKVTEVFSPLSTQPCPWRVARTRAWAASEPLWGSVSARAMISSPAHRRGRKSAATCGAACCARMAPHSPCSMGMYATLKSP